jgi:uncharacterized membrane protein YdbT with pleckstrin-like domain
MPTVAQRIYDLVYDSHLFEELDEEELRELSKELRFYYPANGERVLEQGARSEYFYMVYRGEIQLVQSRGNEEEKPLGVLEAGDYFGEDGLLFKRGLSYTAIAGPATALIRVDKEQFNRLLELPEVKPILRRVAQTRRLADRINLDWIGEDETVYLISRKHAWVLAVMVMLPLFVMGVGGIFAWVGYLSGLDISYLLAGVIAGLGVLWLAWNILDWGNDYYIITSKRVVWVEKIIGMYESRQEAPLHAILSVTTDAGQIARIFDFANVNVRSFTGQITLRDVPKPQEIIDLINELRDRARIQQQRVGHVNIRHKVRQSMRLEDPDPPQRRKRRKRKDKVKQVKGPTLWTDFIHMRYEFGDTITYRKHWLILMYMTWMPFTFVVATVILGIMGFFNILVTITLLMVFGIWLAYQFVDWRNDMYQLTKDKILDIDRKPLGSEQKKEAPLENVLSIEVERIGILGIIFKYGRVVIDVSGTKFTFDDIFDPVTAQQDIFRRLDALKRKKQEEQDEKERRRLSEWFEIYDEEMRNPYNYPD